MSVESGVSGRAGRSGQGRVSHTADRSRQERTTNTAHRMARASSLPHRATTKTAPLSDLFTGPTSLPMIRSLVLFTALAVAVWLGIGG